MTTYTVSTTDELQQQTADADPGDKIVAQGGTYEMSSRWTITNGGTEDKPLVIRGEEGDVPHIKFNTSGDDSGVQFRSPYVHFIGFEVSHSSWKGVNTDGNAHDVVFESLDVHDCRLWGVMNNGRDNVVFRNCDSHHNTGDPANTDGFNMTGTARNGLIEGCRAWANGDDGFDTWISENHVIRNCWAWDNGRDGGGTGDGFKLGGNNRGGYHTVHNCVAVDNMRRGFHWNTTDNPLEVYNNTAIDNPINYRFAQDGPYTLRNNISVNGEVRIDDGVDDEHNSWTLGISDPEFRSTDADSSDYLRLKESSPAIDAGVDVGLPYSGEAPDLGAYEFDRKANGSTSGSRTVLDGEVTLVASDAITNPETYIMSDHDGYTGEGFVQPEPDSGGYAIWELEVPETKRYNFEIRYANGSDIDRTANLTYAGDYQQVTFPRTGAWNNWDTLDGSVEFPSGEVDFALETTGQDAGNIDKIRFWPADSETPDERTVLGEKVILHASDAATNPETKLMADHSGFTGEGFVQPEPDSGGYAIWELVVPEAHTYNYEIRYANGSFIDRTANLTYAGDYQQVTFPQTDAWNRWNIITGTVDLPSGEIDFGIETTGQDAGNIDQIRLWPVDSAGSRATPIGDTPNHGLTTPQQGDDAWHIPLNENFEAIDRALPIVDRDAVKTEYTPAERALYIALDTGAVYVGDGAEWTKLGSVE